MDSGRYILGAEVTAFEREFANYLGIGAVVGTANGTDALSLALRAVGAGPGDRVVTVSHTAIATLAAIAMTGAEPAFVDIDPASFTMDPNVLDETLRFESGRSSVATGRLKAIVVVHLYGHPADMPSILDVARKYGLRVVEDCAQSHGAALAGRKTGTWGDVAAFSFYPTKNLGTFGDGGAVATGDEALATRCRALREYGWDQERVSREPGVNSRLDELQAAFLRVKLRYLERDNATRRTLAGIYSSHLRGTSVIPPRVSPGAEHVYHQYVIRSARRGALRAALERVGVGTAIHYSPPAHEHPAFHRYYDHRRPLIQTQRAAFEVVSLPMYAQLPLAEAHRIAEAVARSTLEHGAISADSTFEAESWRQDDP
jgi:dTDP-4-amino-4,6-dideoxygalactose transaminase